ncbi:hypothetical protein WR25_06620 [Diploscapter pachys]|uniref:DUF7747 domain-containing protein n=1 Tax=Diploscapter pachys TaxID=2018661 RepID=A0A2A2LVG7_9BILA|nr:hypothetical protein WR25_06620 [Diploscapter pachys]
MPRPSAKATADQSEDSPMTSPTRSRKRAHEEEVPGRTIESGRPKRNARKSVLLNSGEFEVAMPGIVKLEEPDPIPEPVNDTPNAAVGKQRKIPQNAANASVSSAIIGKKYGKNKGRGKSNKNANIFDNAEAGPVTRKEAMADTEQFSTSAPELQPSSSHSKQTGKFPLEMKMENLEEIEIGGEEEMVTIDFDPQEGEVIEEVVGQAEGEMGDINEEHPPNLEKMIDFNVSPGRSKNILIGSNGTSRELTVSEIIHIPNVRYRHCAERALSKSVAGRINTFNIKLFEDQIYETEHGDAYATVIPGCLSHLLRKEKILDLLTNPNEIDEIRNAGWLISYPPRLPPLVTHKVCFAFCVELSQNICIKDLSNDDLKPWSSTEPVEGEPIVKPNVRKHPVEKRGDRFVLVKGDSKNYEYHLTEYSAWLPRLFRLRKKIFYVSIRGLIQSNILILYDYTMPGEAPTLINVPHGNNMLRHRVHGNIVNGAMQLKAGGGRIETLAEELSANDAENPFETDLVEGPCNEQFLKVKPSSYGWINNRKLTLKYLINDPQIVEHMGVQNHKLPYLPPLVEEMSVFAYFASAIDIAPHLQHSGDGLSPWTINTPPIDPEESPAPRVRTNRRALSQDLDGNYIIANDQNPPIGLFLIETITVLHRCQRLRKRVLYIQKNTSTMLGNVLFVYEYLRDGPAPMIVKPNTKSAFRQQQHIPSPLLDKRILRSIKASRKLIRAKGELDESADYVNVDDLMEDEDEDGEAHGRLRISRGDAPGTSGTNEHNEVNHHHQAGQLQIKFDVENDPPELDEGSYPVEDTLNNGWDTDFDDDPLEAQENPSPYYDTARQLDSSGHIYLTVRHKRTACNFECVLDYIANTTIVEDRGILNLTKPTHPPLVRNSRAYAFFVAGPVIFPFDINRDDFSPWSANGTPANPTCYRTKVRKIGVVCDPTGSHFEISDADYKKCPFHLVYLYSINPREARLRKKIYYMMDTHARTVVSHALVIYDYHGEGALPRLNGPYIKRSMKLKVKEPKSEVLDPISRLHANLAVNNPNSPVIMNMTPEVRGKLAIEGLWKRAKTTFGTRSDDETFDCLWKMLLAKNEQRLLLNIKNDFGVEIVADYMNGEELEYGGTVEVEADAEGREASGRQTEAEAEADYAEESSELTAMQVVENEVEVAARREEMKEKEKQANQQEDEEDEQLIAV